MATRSPIGDSDVQAFTATLGSGGDVLHPASAGYDAARRVWNGMIDRSPALIARCRDAGEVAAAVGFARDRGLPLAVRGGGHNAAGLAVCDGGVVVDLSPMRDVHVDASRRTARAGGGARWADFDQATQAHGLATTGGAVSTTGIAGLTLGGGLGWLMRRYGLACDNLRSAEVVTADGRRVTASATEHPDLFWALRGGGGNFGVVTSFEYQLHAVSTVIGGMLVHPFARAREVLRFYREVTARAPDELTVFAGMMTLPDGMPVIALVVCWTGDPAAGEEALRPIRAFGPPIADQVGPMPYVQLQRMMDDAFPPGLNVYWRSDFLSSLDDAAVDVLVDHFANVASPLSMMLIEQFGGAVSRVGRNETAFPHRDATYNLAIVARWPEPSMADANVAWTRGLWEAMRPFAAGVYVNYLGVGEGDERVRAAYGDATYRRLVAVKDTYDPGNLFRLNQNVRPSGSA